MAEFNIDKEKLAEACNDIVRALNTEYCEAFDELASVLKPVVQEPDAPEYARELFKCCADVQRLYNEEGFLDSVNSFVDAVTNTYELAEKLDKKQVSAVPHLDVSAQVENIETDVL